MARLSKTTPFQIHNDNPDYIPTPDNTTHEIRKEQDLLARPFSWAGRKKDDGFVTESDDDAKGGRDDGAQEGDDEKNYTRTSISSFPESSYPTDFEHTPMHKPYTPTYARPSTRRLPMSSPLRKGKFATPQSDPRCSPRTRRRELDPEELEAKQAPLVLLHITALPVNIPWDLQSMREILPPHIMDNVQLLKSNLSDTVLRRGILIPHPREDYELLEERLLETLDLQEPRISKCGHFRNRHSTSSTATTGSESADSGVGSSVDGTDEEHCSTCHHHLQAAGSGKQKWSIKVFASNGLMRASAWVAAWSEMERVDVEIMPWIKDDLRFKLDEMKAEKHASKQTDPEANELRINRIVEDRLRLLEEDGERARQAAMSREIDKIVLDEQRRNLHAAQPVPMASIEAAKLSEPERAPASAAAPSPAPANESASAELPNIYRPNQIPLSMLIRNYVFLLAKKPTNMIVLFLMITVSWLCATLGPAGVHASVFELSMHAHAKIKAFQDISAPYLLGESASDQSDPFPEIKTGGQDISQSVQEHQVPDLTIKSESIEPAQDNFKVEEEPYVVESVAEPESIESSLKAFELADQSYRADLPAQVHSSGPVQDFDYTENSVELVSPEQTADLESESMENASDIGDKEDTSNADIGSPSVESAARSEVLPADERSGVGHNEEQEPETDDVAADPIEEVTFDAPETLIGPNDAADKDSDVGHGEEQQAETGDTPAVLIEETVPDMSELAIDVISHGDDNKDHVTNPDNADDTTESEPFHTLNDALVDLEQDEGHVMPEERPEVCLKPDVFSRTQILDEMLTSELPQREVAAQCLPYSMFWEPWEECGL